MNKSKNIFARRIIASSIDMMLISLLQIVLWLALLYYGYKQWWVIKLLTIPGDGTTYVYFIFLISCYTLQEIIFHTSIGKRIFGLKIISTNGQKLKLYQILLRNVFRLVDQILLIGSVWCFIDIKNRRLGDIVSKSEIVFVKSNLKCQSAQTYI